MKGLITYFFFKKQAFSTMLMPSTLQSTSSSLSVRRIFLMVVPCFRVVVDPFTFKLLIRLTVSPSFRVLPLASLTFDTSMVTNVGPLTRPCLNPLQKEAGHAIQKSPAIKPGKYHVLGSYRKKSARSLDPLNP